jgi:DNA-binding NarL/FixJ family response regulator
MPPTRVLVAEHSDLLRAGLVALLEQQPDLVVTKAVRSPEHALDSLRTDDADVVVLDDETPGSAPQATCASISERVPSASVVVLSRRTSDAHIAAYLGAGARGYVIKGSPVQQLVDAVRTVGSGKVALPEASARRLLGRVRPEPSRARRPLRRFLLGRARAPRSRGVM